MADFKELILSNDFKAYRKKQLIVIVEHINNLIKDGVCRELKSSELQGALQMAVKLLRLPSELIGDRELKDELNKQIQEDVIGLTTYLVRENLK